MKQSSRFPARRVKSLKMVSALRSRRFQHLARAKSPYIVYVWIIEFFHHSAALTLYEVLK